MSAFGVPVARLSAIAQRHIDDLRESEALALVPLAEDDDVSPAEFVAMIRYRAIAQLRASFKDDPAALRAFITSVDFDEVTVSI